MAKNLPSIREFSNSLRRYLKLFTSKLNHSQTIPGGLFAPKIALYSILTLILTLSVLFITIDHTKKNDNRSPLASLAQIQPFEITSPENYEGLPVAKVESYPVSNSWGTVVYLPQYHRSPGSGAEEKINDAGAKSQEEIYKIISFLIDKTDINLAMVEGSTFGEIPGEKVALLADKIVRRDEAVSLVGSLQTAFQKENLSASEEEQLLKNLNREISKIDREIALEGAAEKLKAEGKDIKLYGSENEATREESKLILRDYIYLSDRINQLSKSTAEKKNAANPVKGSAQLPSLKSLLNKSSKPDFNSLESQANTQGKEDLSQLLTKTETAFNELAHNTPKKIMIQEDSNTPSRSDNPYKNMTDQDELKDKLAATKKQLNEVIVQKRNKETAENFAHALKNENQSIGILQFGAGHKEGLVKELNNQGLSVVIITPTEVSNRQSV